MGGRDGGTQTYCPECGDVQVCQAVLTTQLGVPAGQRWYHVKYPDLQYFRRARRCRECNEEWLTVEIPEEFLDELIQLRGALADLKAHAEEYIAQSEGAAKALRDLSRSLAVLRGLEPYASA